MEHNDFGHGPKYGLNYSGSLRKIFAMLFLWILKKKIFVETGQGGVLRIVVDCHATWGSSLP